MCCCVCWYTKTYYLYYIYLPGIFFNGIHSPKKWKNGVYVCVYNACGAALCCSRFLTALLRSCINFVCPKHSLCLSCKETQPKKKWSWNRWHILGGRINKRITTALCAAPAAITLYAGRDLFHVSCFVFWKLEGAWKKWNNCAASFGRAILRRRKV